MTSEDIKKLYAEMDKAYKFIDGFVDDYTKDEDEKKEFYDALNTIIENNIEIEKECNQ